MSNYLEQVVPVIVTFNPDIDGLERLLNSLSGFNQVKIIDNGSDNNLVLLIKSLLSRYLNVQASFSLSNLGIAEAQNIAVSEIQQLSKKTSFVFLLDQDSVPIGNCVEVLFDYANLIMNEGIKLAVIGPVLFDGYSNKNIGFISNGKRLYNEQAKNKYFHCDGINSSGSLIPLPVWQELGGNNIKLFIDHVETDWCFRARALGYSCFGTFDAELLHSMGDSTAEFWFFGKRRMPNRAPERHYYVFRNSIFLQKMNYVPLGWKLANLVKLFFTAFYFCSFSTKRSQHFSSMYRGIIDGVRDRLGKN